MKIAIHQPNYLPWCGYFAKLKACDAFIILDDAQISKGSYVARTKIRSAGAEQWLTIPTRLHGAPAIAEVAVANDLWPKKHLATLYQVYGKALHFKEIMGFLEPIYLDAGGSLSSFNQRMLTAVMDYLGIERRIYLSSSFEIKATGDDRLVELVKTLGGTHYISGAGGTKYQDSSKFESAEIRLDVRTYVPVPYETSKFPFSPGLSIIDALFIVGRKTSELLRY